MTATATTCTSVRVMLSYDIQAPGRKSFSAPTEDYDERSMPNILTGLSDCLNAECYSEMLED